MKYMITLTDEQLSHFRLDDDGKTLVLTDALGGTRAFPIETIKQGAGVWEWEMYPEASTYSQKLICSMCGVKLPSTIVDEYGGILPYCPRCGSWMIGVLADDSSVPRKEKSDKKVNPIIEYVEGVESDHASIDIPKEKMRPGYLTSQMVRRMRRKARKKNENN